MSSVAIGQASYSLVTMWSSALGHGIILLASPGQQLRESKIWIPHDGMETGIANQLVALNVPKQDIVLAFHEPEVRQFTDFGTGNEVVEDGTKVNFA